LRSLTKLGFQKLSVSITATKKLLRALKGANVPIIRDPGVMADKVVSNAMDISKSMTTSTRELLKNNYDLSGAGYNPAIHTIFIPRNEGSPLKTLFHEAGHASDMNVKKYPDRDVLLENPMTTSVRTSYKKELDANKRARRFIQRYEKPELVSKSLRDFNIMANRTNLKSYKKSYVPIIISRRRLAKGTLLSEPLTFSEIKDALKYLKGK